MENRTADNHILVATICFATSSLGLTVNGVVIFCLLRFKELRHAFGYLSVSLMIADSGVLGVVLMGIAPFTLLQERRFDWTKKWFGHISLTFWFASLYGMAMIAINRYLVISHPHNYKEICSKHKIRRFITCSWVLAALHSCVYFIPGCDLHYEPLNYSWHYANSSCQTPMMFLDLVYGVVFVVFIFGINFATAFSLHKHNQELFSLVDIGMLDRVLVQRYMREARFFIQALLHAFLFIMILISFHIISHFITNILLHFFSSTWVWQIAHSTNGFLLVILNDKLRKRIFRILTRQTATPV